MWRYIFIIIVSAPPRFIPALYKVREDESAFKRRKLSYSIDNAFIVFAACRRLKLPLSDYIYTMKPIIRGLMPPFIMNRYHKRRLMNEGIYS